MEWEWRVRTESPNAKRSAPSVSLLTTVTEPSRLDAQESPDGFSAVVNLLIPSAPVLLQPENNADIFEGDSNLFEWQASTGQTQFAFRRITEPEGEWSSELRLTSLPGSHVRGVAFSHDSRYLASANQSTPFFHLFDRDDNWSMVPDIPTFLPGLTYMPAFSPDGTMIAFAHAIGAGSTGLTVVNVSDWSVVTGVPDFGATALRVAWSPDGSQLAVSAGTAGEFALRVYNTGDWSIRFTTGATPVGSRWGLAYSPDGSVIAVASAGSSDQIAVFSADTGNLLVRPKTGDATADGRGVFSCAFSTRGELVVGRTLGYFDAWDSATWAYRPDAYPRVSSNNSIFGLSFDSKGGYVGAVFTGGPTLNIRKTITLEAVSVENPPGGFTYMYHCASSPAGDFFATGGENFLQIHQVDPRPIEFWDGVAWQPNESFVASTDENVTFPPATWPTNNG